MRLDREGRRELLPMRWGFPKVQKSYVTNARKLSSPYWRNWLKPGFRCLVPVTAFSEYHPTERYEGRKPAVWFALDEARRPSPSLGCGGRGRASGGKARWASSSASRS